MKLQNEPNFESKLRMTSYRQIEANRRNALNSTGPRTEAGKQQSRRNAVRHGLTAETVIGVLEDAEDYRQFEATVIADYDAQSAVERQLVLRLASVLWRLRRATTMETGLFEIQAEHLREYRQGRHLLADSRDAIQAAPEGTHLGNYDRRLSESRHEIETLASSQMETDGFPPEFARCFLRLANLPNFALDRLSRYEAGLWRQVRQILFTLDALDRRKPHERIRRFLFSGKDLPRDLQSHELLPHAR
jgi:hypothetical protein